MRNKIIANIFINKIVTAIKDIRGEFCFKTDGHEIIAIFSENRNNDLVKRLKEILIGNSVDKEKSENCNIKIQQKIRIPESEKQFV